MPPSHRERIAAPHPARRAGSRAGPRLDEPALVGDLVGGLAHDLNNQLAAISGHLELARGVADPVRHAKLVEGAERAVSRAAVLVRRLLAVSRRAPAVRERVDLNALVASCAEEARAAFPKARVVADLDPLLAAIEGHGMMLGQALSTVLARACACAGDTCTVAVCTANVVLGEAQTETKPWILPGAYAQIEVSGQGLHPSPGAASPFFDPFLAGALSGGEAGREMSIVYAIVKHHRGYIHAAKAEDGGMALRIDLPVL